jgi:DNA-binding NarL/FixJ family response regulator
VKLKLTRKDRALCQLLVEGCGNREIAAKTGLALRTVKHHFQEMFARNGIRTGIKRVKLAVRFYRENLPSC